MNTSIDPQISFPTTLQKFLTLETLFTAIWVVVVFIALFTLLKILQLMLKYVLKKRVSNKTSDFIQKTVRYIGFLLIIFTIFNIIGVDVSALLGAAGIFGIAVGFAAQTSVSNIISGLFLISEKSFTVGDVITVNSITGIVKTIDLLSVKLQTFDNKYVRIPNESCIKSDIINITRYPIRRMDLNFIVPFETNLKVLKDALSEAASGNEFVLSNPEMFYLMEGFDPSGWKILFCVWFVQNNFVNLRNTIIPDLKYSLDKHTISISYQTVRIIEGSTQVK